MTSSEVMKASQEQISLAGPSPGILSSAKKKKKKKKKRKTKENRINRSRDLGDGNSVHICVLRHSILFQSGLVVLYVWYTAVNLRSLFTVFLGISFIPLQC